MSLAELNLSTEAGARSALARIRWSADRFCDAGAGRQTLERANAVQRCVATMTRNSVTQLDAPIVTALFEGRATREEPTRMALAQQ